MMRTHWSGLLVALAGMSLAIAPVSAGAQPPAGQTAKDSPPPPPRVPDHSSDALTTRPLELLVTEVPRNHWAYDALFQIAQRGMSIGRPIEDVSGRRALTRFQMAMATQVASIDTIRYAISVIGSPWSFDSRSIEQYERRRSPFTLAINVNPANPKHDDRRRLLLRRDLDTMQKLNQEFREELGFMGVDLVQQSGKLRALQDRWGRLQQLSLLVDRSGRRRKGEPPLETSEAPDPESGDCRLW